MPPALLRILRGEPDRAERPFARRLLAGLARGAIRDGAQALGALEAFWAFVGVAPDHAGMALRLRAALADGISIEIGDDFEWVRVHGGGTHDLLSREPARRVLRALVAAGGAPVAVRDLVEQAWPGEVLVGS